ncbi:hypothetical protein RGU41_17970 [Cryobacterium sp. 10C3]|nr:hypothetical protein [Cryobacterium sp. 10C3]MDY7558467.1 hypothetical protein [Cryobacterium sp. 10C3]
MASFAFAVASVACASSTAASRLSVSTVASTWPAVTVVPATTGTAVTVPDTAKLTESFTVGVAVPSLSTVFCMVVRLAAVVMGAATVDLVFAGTANPNQ